MKETLEIIGWAACSIILIAAMIRYIYKFIKKYIHKQISKIMLNIIFNNYEVEEEITRIVKNNFKNLKRK